MPHMEKTTYLVLFQDHHKMPRHYATFILKHCMYLKSFISFINTNKFYKKKLTKNILQF